MRSTLLIFLISILLNFSVNAQLPTQKIFKEVKGMEFLGPTTFTRIFDPGAEFLLKQLCTTEVDSMLNGVMVWSNAYLDVEAKIKSVQEYVIEDDTLRSIKITVKGNEIDRMDSLLFATQDCPVYKMSVCGQSISFYERKASFGAEIRQVWIKAAAEGVLECWEF